METSNAELRLEGKTLKVPSIRVGDYMIIARRKWFTMASVLGEEWLPDEAISDPEPILAKLREGALHADVFTFAQRIYESRPRYCYPMFRDNVAAIPTEDFTAWWERRVSRKLRQDVAKSNKLGMEVREVVFDDELVRGIMGIYNESPLRQGRRFWHYGKDFETVKRENSTYLERSKFLAAFWEGELVGFVKIVFVGKIGRFMQILSMTKHNDKRPLNALIAKAVELCAKRGCLYLVYGKYTYDARKNSSIVDFKRRNGFEEVRFPRYFVPLTFKGKLAMKLGLHLGYKRLIPSRLLQLVLDFRAKVLEARTGTSTPKPSDGERTNKAAA